ncbi:MAG: ribokinase [Chloroflexi bacterium]|nr:ribokinase [Chloroflexota bacterium]MYK61435.1 ribokinase [Chloroflexota bacterium]
MPISENMTDKSIQADNPKTTLLLGAINMDLLVETERLARAGETFVCERLYTSGGGKAGNQSVAAARFAGDAGGAVKMFGRVGDDAFGNELRGFMSEQGVDMGTVTTDAEIETGVAIIFIDPTGENFVHAIYGGNGKCGDVEADATIDAMSDAGVLLVQQEIPLECSIRAMVAARERGVPVVLDPAPAIPIDIVPDGFYASADILTPNVIEAEALSGVGISDVDSAEHAADKIRELHGCECVIVTMAGDGVFVASDVLRGHMPPFEVEAVATVAAGDAFAGVLGRALCEGNDLEDAIRLAMAAGALCVSRPGTQSAMPYRDEVLALVASSS